MSLRTIYFNGHQETTLAADVGGNPRNPPVILLHGGGQTRHSWGRGSTRAGAVGLLQHRP